MRVLTGLRSHQSTWRRKLLASAVSLKEEIPSLTPTLGREQVKIGSRRSASISVTMGTVPRETSVSTPMIRSCVRRLLRSSELAVTVLGPRLIVVAKAVGGEAVERETAKAKIAVQAVDGLDVGIVPGGDQETRLAVEEIEAKDEGTSKESCALTS